MSFRWTAKIKNGMNRMIKVGHEKLMIFHYMQKPEDPKKKVAPDDPSGSDGSSGTTLNSIPVNEVAPRYGLGKLFNSHS